MPTEDKRQSAMTKGSRSRGRDSVDHDSLLSPNRYHRTVIASVLVASLVAIVPLLLMTNLTYRQYRGAFRSELTRPMVRFTSAGKQALESFLSERLSALAMVMRESSAADLRDTDRLDTLLSNMKESFGGIVDLGVIDRDGIQVAYAGPYDLEGRDYSDEEWVDDVRTHGVVVSDVFRGYRDHPHLVIALQRDLADGFVILRATIDTDVLHFLVRDRTVRRVAQGDACGRCHSVGVQPSSDAFIINRDGVLQTPSRSYGEVLEDSPLPALPFSAEVELIEIRDNRGTDLLVSYAHIDRSPFTLVLVNPQLDLHGGLQSIRKDVRVLLVVSIALILTIITLGSIYVSNRLRAADLKRATIYHKMEYTNKLAAIGRLGAGVAHEINNPLSIINEKAGLLKDLLTLSETAPPREKLVGIADAILKSAERCGGITHRLLGFAKHMDVQLEDVDLDRLLHEVLEFLEKEASYRSLTVVFDYPEHPPKVFSDRSQLQQVFLNIINNAFAAVSDGGHIGIGIRETGESVEVSISDDGEGIPESQVDQIFDPFFTTKKGKGTGLGLSITYGIVEKLGGQISVKSKVGEGTCFTVTLPVGGNPG